MKKIFKNGETLFKVGGHWYLIDKEAKIKEGDENIWDLEESKFNPLVKILGNTNIVRERIKNKSLAKLIASTDKSLPVHHFSIPERVYSEEDMRKAFNAGYDYAREGIILQPDEYGFIQSLNEIESIKLEYWDCEIDGLGELIVTVNYK